MVDMSELNAIFGNGTYDDWVKSFYCQEFVSVWVPCIFLLIVSPFYFAFTLKSKTRLSYSSIYFFKTGLGVSLIVIHIVDLIYRLHEYFTLVYVHPLHLLQPCVLLISEILATILVTFDKHHGKRISILLFIYRIMSEISTCLVVYASARCLIHPDDFKEQHGHQHYCNLICFVVLVIVLLLNTILLLLTGCLTEADKDHVGHERESPETSACIFSTLTFLWFFKLARQASINGSLDCSDIWRLKEDFRCRELSKRFHLEWFRCHLIRSDDGKEAIESVGIVKEDHHWRNGRKYETECLEDPVADENIVLEEQLLNSGPDVSVRAGQKSRSPGRYILLRVLCKVFGGSFVIGMCLNVLHDLLTFVSPYVFKRLIGFIMDEDAPISEGFVYVVLLLSCSCIQIILRHQFMLRYNVIGLSVQSALISEIYKKSLVLQSSDDVEVGKMVNLMSVDVQKMVDTTTMVNCLWSCPIQLVLGTYFLWQLLGPSILGGMLVAVVMLPVNGWVAKKCKKFQINQMKFKDARIKLLDEVINGIKVIKLYAWEAVFKGKISKIRSDELRVIRRAAYLMAVATFAWCSTPFLISLSTFGLYLVSSPENVLTAEKAFVSLTLFNILRLPLSMLPMFITNVIVAKVSLRRIEKFLSLQEIRHQNPSFTNSHISKDALPAVSLKNASLGWGKTGEQNVVLSSISLEIPKGHLVAVVGCVGCGKSTLLSAMIREAQIFEGECQIEGSISYSGQQSWLQNKTIKENILFGSKMDPSRYVKVLEASALLPDLESLPAGDETEVGERGVSLSGGQKQRVCFARALYSSEAEVFVFDDPFSSVDPDVSRCMFTRGLSHSGLIRHKTRIIATNSVSFLPFMDMIIILSSEGTISEVGSYNTLLTGSKGFNLFAQNYINNNNNDGKISSQAANGLKRFQSLTEVNITPKDLGKTTSISPHFKWNHSHHKSCLEINNQTDEDDEDCDSLLHRLPNLAKSETFLEEILLESAKTANLGTESIPESKGKNAGKLVEDEEVKRERVSSKVFLAYLRSVGFPLGVLALMCFIANNLLSVSTNIWLSIWTGASKIHNSSHHASEAVSNVSDKKSVEIQNYRGLGIYATLGFGYVMTLLLRSFISALACSRASKVIYSNLVECLLSVPLLFFDSTPKGRIINRASSDVATLDYVMPFTISGFCNIVLMCLATLGIIVANIQLFSIPFVVLLVVYIFLQRLFVITTRQLRRMSSSLRSHILSHLSETLQGISTIRSFGETSRFTDEMYEKVDAMQEVCYLSCVSQRWLGVWLEFIGTILVSCVALFAVLGKEGLTPGTVALSLTYAFDIIQNLNSLVTMICELETSLVAVERIKEYSDLEPEEAKNINSPNLPLSWPDKGQIEFQDFSSNYRPGTEFVLKKFSILIKPGEKIGIVGRTGSGKSSVLMSMFRVLRAIEGGVIVDDIDIANVPLKSLRSFMTLVPQDPVIFSGSIRFNLDPFGTCSDEEIWNSLTETSLKKHVLELTEHLEHECNPNGNSLSLGQQQLLCLNRALLRKSKILMLDEATASIDVETEEVIKYFLEKKFQTTSSQCKTTEQLLNDLEKVENSRQEPCTLIIVAHRVSTVMGCDRVLVLNDGKLEEIGEPKRLFGDKNSRFYRVCGDHS